MSEVDATSVHMARLVDVFKQHLAQKEHAEIQRKAELDSKYESKAITVMSQDEPKLLELIAQLGDGLKEGLEAPQYLSTHIAKFGDPVYQSALAALPEIKLQAEVVKVLSESDDRVVASSLLDNVEAVDAFPQALLNIDDRHRDDLFSKLAAHPALRHFPGTVADYMRRTVFDELTSVALRIVANTDALLADLENMVWFADRGNLAVKRELAKSKVLIASPEAVEVLVEALLKLEEELPVGPDQDNLAASLFGNTKALAASDEAMKLLWLDKNHFYRDVVVERRNSCLQFDAAVDKLENGDQKACDVFVSSSPDPKSSDEFRLDI
jgi:hypothetical protein